MTDAIQLEIDQHCAVVTLNRPDKLNALTVDMLDALSEIATRLDGDRDVRCVILTGAGERAFCVGADINAWSALEPLDMWFAWVKRGHRVFDQWARLRQPVIAALNGHALGGGLEFAAAADLRVAAPTVQLGLPEATIGTVPGWSGTQRLVGLIGASRAKYLALTGRRIDAAQAQQFGFIHEIASGESALYVARRLAADVCRLAPVSAQLAKQLIDAGSGAALPAALESLAGALAMTTADAREGVASFREKRPPQYRGE